MNPPRKSLVRLAVCLVLYLAAGLALSQQPASNDTHNATADASGASDQKVHDAGVRFAEALGLKEKMAASIDPSVEKGVAALRAQTPAFPPEFIEEWRKRMKVRMEHSDFVEIVVQVYAKYFTADELNQLADVVESRKQSKPAELPDALKEKFQKNAVLIQSEIIGGCTQLGARLGGEVAQEIAKEHPDWAPKPSQPAK